MSELERERHKNTGLERARDSWYREWFKGNERITELETKVERLKTRVIAEEDDKNKRLDEMRAALAKQSLHVEDCHRQVEQAEAKLADCAKTCGGLEYRLEQAEALIATLKTKLAVRIGERDADRLMIALQDRDLWQAEFESGLWHAECIMSAIAADNAVAELAALKAENDRLKVCGNCGHSEFDGSYFDCEWQPRGEDEWDELAHPSLTLCCYSPSRWEARP